MAVEDVEGVDDHDGAARVWCYEAMVEDVRRGLGAVLLSLSLPIGSGGSVEVSGDGSVRCYLLLVLQGSPAKLSWLSCQAAAWKQTGYRLPAIDKGVALDSLLERFMGGTMLS